MNHKFDEDAYRDRQTNKYLEEQEGNEAVSNCCGSPICEESDVCCDCKEMCAPITQSEFDAEEYEAAMCDRADSERELAREEG